MAADRVSERMTEHDHEPGNLRIFDAYQMPVARPEHHSGKPVDVTGRSPESEHSSYMEMTPALHGKPAVIGPFNLTTAQLREWRNHTDDANIDMMIQSGELRQSTADMLKERVAQRAVFELLECGQDLSRDMLMRYIPADMQRMVEIYLRDKPRS